MIHTLDIFGFTLSEPTTTITDYLITAVSWWYGRGLMTSGRDGLANRLWGLGFLCIGLGALLGGTSHGFAFYLGATSNFVIWKATVYAVGLSMLFAVAGTVEGSRPGNNVRYLLHAANATAFAVYAFWMLSHSEFVYVIYHYVPAMILVALIQVWAWIDHRAQSAPWLTGGVLVTLIGAAVQQSGFTVHPHFNNNDLYHVIQIAGLYLLNKGCLQLTANAS